MKNSAADRVAQFVEDLLKGRRPRRFEATQEEAEAMSAAAGLTASHVGADLPDKAALDRIHREPTDRIGHTGMIDLRHDENPPEMRCLVAVRTGREAAIRALWLREVRAG